MASLVPPRNFLPITTARNSLTSMAATIIAVQQLHGQVHITPIPQDDAPKQFDNLVLNPEMKCSEQSEDHLKIPMRSA
jgi:hypothetical protein